ncbi:pilus assembly FimT family protein [Anabaena sp. WFMT]|uniref:pilus assembly FimT family protein n=1 Tax=Anabaena sp. WFMT TaxID=3449730 RepID=UPI003F200F0F
MNTRCKYSFDKSISGFTLLENLVVVFVIGILSAIAAPSWLGFVNIRRLNVAQGQVYQAMREAQNQAKKEKLTWQASFREQNSIVQWAIHPATVSPSNAVWNSLDSSVRLDNETNLDLVNNVRQIQFDYMGSVKLQQLGRVTLFSQSGGTAKRCVIASTILGAMRTAKDRPTAQDGKFCY